MHNGVALVTEYVKSLIKVYLAIMITHLFIHFTLKLIIL